MLHQVGKDLIRLRFELDWHSSTAQLTTVGVEDILVKDVQHSHAFPGVKAINSLLCTVQGSTEQALDQASQGDSKPRQVGPQALCSVSLEVPSPGTRQRVRVRT